MWIAAFFLLLAIVILAIFACKKLFPVLMPAGRRKILALGWFGGLTGIITNAFVWQLGPEVAGINPVAAFVGCFLFIIVGGLFPFLRIGLGWS